MNSRAVSAHFLMDEGKLCCWLGFCKTASGRPITAVQLTAVDGGVQQAAAKTTTIDEKKKKRMDEEDGAACQMQTPLQQSKQAMLIVLHAERTAEKRKERMICNNKWLETHSSWVGTHILVPAR